MYRSHVLVCGGTGCTSSGSEQIIQTHDNETLLSWLEDITPAERRQVRKYLNNFKDSGKELCNDLICLVMQSVANLCIVPMQDYLGLDNSARMNQPSTLGKNWKWRLKEGQFHGRTSERNAGTGNTLRKKINKDHSRTSGNWRSFFLL